MDLNSVKKRILQGLLFTAICSPLLIHIARADDYFDFVMPWDDASQNITNLSYLSPAPAGEDGFVTVKNGHLYTGDKRLKLLGVNLVFNGTTPDHSTADKIAARLARFGINAVRFHHMDGPPAPRGLLNADKRSLNAEQLDRFDYFFAALKKHGIYSDINLQVIRVYPGFLPSPDATVWKTAKGIDLFYPDFINLQKEYAHSLLLHRNPYTGNRYVDEPALALVEINNENGLIQSWYAGHLDRMNDTYRKTLGSMWGRWLESRYGSQQKRMDEWSTKWVMGKDILQETSTTSQWQLQVANGAKGKLSLSKNNVQTATITRASTESWDAQLHWPNISVAVKDRYQLALKIRTNTAKTLTISVMQNHAPWQMLWHQTINAEKEWKTVTAQFSVPYDEQSARLTISGMGLKKGSIDISDSHLFRMAPSKEASPTTAETTTLTIPTKKGFEKLSFDAKHDWMNFLWETEKAYWEDMQGYLKKTLGVKAPLIGTQANWNSPAGIQASMDVIDAHAYWDHPQFPRKKYDVNDFVMRNRPLAGAKDAGPIVDLALARVIGKPFVVTEYDHPFPNSYEAEGIPLLAAYASLQDWDGIFQFCYGLGGDDWSSNRVVQFFDSHANPVKMAGLLSAALMFRQGGVSASKAANPASPMPFDTSASNWLPIIQTNQRVPSASDVGVKRHQALYEAVGFNVKEQTAGIKMPVTSDTAELTWGTPSSTVTINTKQSKGIIGAPLGRVHLGKWEMELTGAPLKRGVLLAHTMDGKDFDNSSKILVISMGEVRNAGQTHPFSNTPNSAPWGIGPTQLATTPAKLQIPIPSTQVQAWALDNQGNRKALLPIKGTNNAVIILNQKTLWYELQIKRHAQ